jgi:hypothetical protein
MKKVESTIPERIKKTEEFQLGLFEGIVKGQIDAEKFMQRMTDNFTKPNMKIVLPVPHPENLTFKTIFKLLFWKIKNIF